MPRAGQQPVQQADGKGITGTCRVYLLGGNGIDVQVAGGGVRIRSPQEVGTGA